MSKLGLCPFCGSITLEKGCCGCDGKGKEKEVKKEPSRRSKPK